MKKLLLTILVLSSSVFALDAQSWLWAKEGHNGKSKATYLNGATSSAMDKYHNVYETGKYDGDTIAFNSDTLFGQPFGTFLVKYDENGNVLWARSSETNKNNANPFTVSLFVVTDSKNNIYISGEFEDTIGFSPYYLSSPTNYVNAFLVKYDGKGNVRWARQSNTSYKGLNVGFSLSTDKEDNIYMTGYYQSNVSFGKDTLKGTIYPNTFLVKYDSNGNVIWTKQGINGASGYSAGQSVITDNKGYIYITGYYVDSITFGNQTLSIPSATYQNNLFIAKYDSNGNVIWAKQAILLKGNSNSCGDALAKDNAGNIYITGYFYDTVSFGATTLINSYMGQNIFWSKYDENGNVLWAKQAYQPDSLYWQGWSINTDDNNNLYLAGIEANGGPYNGKIIFGSDTLKSKVTLGLVWLKFDSGGNVLNAYIFPTGGSGPQTPNSVDSSGCYVYLGGTTLDTTILFGSDTIGSHWHTFIPFMTRWSDGSCPTGINTIESRNLSVNLYPNPNNGNFTIVFSHPELGSESQPTIEIYNMLGEKIYSKEFLVSDSQFPINIGSQPSGIYLYRITDQQSNLLSSGKFIIQ